MINIFSLIFHSLEGLSYWHSTVLKYVCKLTFLSHHVSVVITLIKGTLEALTRAVANKKLVVSVIITVTVIYSLKKSSQNFCTNSVKDLTTFEIEIY